MAGNGQYADGQRMIANCEQEVHTFLHALVVSSRQDGLLARP